MAIRATTSICGTGSRASRLLGLLLCLAGPLSAQGLAPVRDYQALDRHALQTPGAETTSLERLAKYLVTPARDDFDKARVFYRWIAENIIYDVPAYYRNTPSATSAEETLLGRKSVCQGYSELFKALGEAVGLEVALVSGYGKGVGYKPGMGFKETNHAWNAVKIAGQWYLLDATWGAGHVAGQGRYVKRFDDFYFLTPPAQFIYNHLPADVQWQLLDPPLDMYQYDHMILPRPEFFRCGLELVTHRDGIIRGGPKLRVGFRAPANVYMLAKLKQGDRDLSDWPIKGQRAGKDIWFDLSLPATGSYDLVFYANPKSLTGTYDSVLRYSVEYGTPPPAPRDDE